MLAADAARAQPTSYDGWQVVTVNAETPSQLQALEAIPHRDMFGHGGDLGPNIVLVSPSSLQALTAQGLSYTVDIGDYQDYLEDIATLRGMYGNVPAQEPAIYLANPFTGAPSGNIGVITQALGPPPTIENAWYWSWHTLDEVYEKLEALRDRYAAATDLDLEVRSIGTSVEGREIKTLRITGPVQEGQRPALYIRSGIHAAEQVGILSSMYIIEAMLSTYAHGDARMVELVKNVELYVTPIQNPDGYNYFIESDDVWVRKNRHDYQPQFGVCTITDEESVNNNIGVELNRNWDVKWCETESHDHCNRRYCGPEAMSEPEVQAIADFILSTPNLAANLDIHAYTQLVLIPWAYDRNGAHPHQDVYTQLRQDVIAQIESKHGENYQGAIGYDLTGGSTDWTQLQGLWSMAFETRPFDIDPYPAGFNPMNNEQMPTVVLAGEELLKGTLFYAEFLVQDRDNDGVVNGFDNCPAAQNFTQRDCDGNHIGDACDMITPQCASDTVIVLDRSGSMATRDGYSGATRGAHALSGFGAYLYNSFFTPGESWASMIGFASGPSCLAYPSGSSACDFVDIKKNVASPSQDANSIESSFALDALNQTTASYAADGKTDILEAVRFGVDNLDHSPSGAERQYLYLLSDGQQTERFVQADYDALLAELQDHPNLTISALAVTPEADMEELLKYTAPTNGAIGYAEEANGAPVYWHDVQAQTIRELAVLAGPDKITTPSEILVVQEASTNGSLGFSVSLDATSFTVVLSSRATDWNLSLRLTDRLGHSFSPTSHPQLFSKPSFDDTVLIAYIPNPTDGAWTLITGAPADTSSNFIITEVNPKASVELDGNTRVITPGQTATFTPSIEYNGVPLNVNTANCSAVKATVPGGRTLYAAELTANAVVVSNTPARIASGLPPTIQLTPFAGRGYYTVQVRCDVTSSAQAAPGAQLHGSINSFTHNASFTVFADVPQMPSCSNADCDGDGVPNTSEGSGDSDGDGWLDRFDSDADNDEIGDARDTCPVVPNPEQLPNAPGVVLTAAAMTVNSCVPQSTNVVLTPPTVKVGCVNPSAVTLKAELISVRGHALPTALPLDPTNAALPVGVSTVRWTGTAPFGITGTTQQTITVGLGETAAACCTGKTVVQGTALPDIMLRPLSGQYCMLGVGSFDVLVGGPQADSMFGGDGSDKITSGDSGSIASGGPGADLLTTVAGATYGGAGGDVISMTGGGELYGNEGDDDISSILANHNIYPGPGRDVVQAGSGNDHVYVYDACELAAFEVLDGGFGNDTLHTPLPLRDLLLRGVIVLNFENIVVETNNRHLSECF